ncbi:MAG: oligosaccharide flippase family protein [Bacteroidota bacterium]|nr:oligosaccharide flippase family protein [Bacteroidota bacterium]
MIKRIKLFVASFLKGHERTVRLKLNIIGSFLIKFFGLVVSYLLVPICLNYLDKSRYGIWLTITSFLTWFSFFEIGMGAGLQNKLSEAFSLKKYKLARIYVSTTYLLLTLIIFVVALIFFATQPLMNWSKILNAPPEMAEELKNVAMLVFGFFFLQFILRLINTILNADQKSALANFNGPFSSFVALIFIYILTKVAPPSLLLLAGAFCISQIIVLLIANGYYFKKLYWNIRPSFFFYRKKYVKKLIGLGVNFFLIQMSALVIFQTTNILIAQYFGPTEVTQYNIAYKLFSTIFIIFQIVTLPLWPAFTEAWVKNDVDWIRATVRRIYKLWIKLTFLTVFLLVFSGIIYKLWVGNKVIIPFELSLSIALYFLLFSFGSIYNMFINGISKLRVQALSLLIGAILFIPLTILFVRVFKTGVVGLILSMIISNFYSYTIAPIQYFKLIKGTAKGIWTK